MLTLTKNQQENLNNVKEWIYSDISQVVRCIFTNSSIENGKLCDGAILAVIVDSNKEIATKDKHKIYQYNAKRKPKEIMLRLITSGTEDCYTDILGGVEEYKKRY